MGVWQARCEAGFDMNWQEGKGEGGEGGVNLCGQHQTVHCS